jgi:hypothetical protein
MANVCRAKGSFHDNPDWSNQDLVRDTPRVVLKFVKPIARLMEILDIQRLTLLEAYWKSLVSTVFRFSLFAFSVPSG